MWERDQLVDLIRLAAQGQPHPSLEDLRPEDLADAIQLVEPEEGAAALARIDPMTAAQALVEAPTSTVKALVPHISDKTLAAYLDILPMDDASDLREEVDAERWERLLGLIPSEDAEEIRRLLGYPEGTVGRLMTEAFFDVSGEATIESVLNDLRSASAAKYETVNDLYVLDGEKRLLGVISLRKVLRAHPRMTVGEVMNDDVITAKVMDSDEEAARTMARYGFYALPVVDDFGRLKGIFTGDDAQAVLREAETEDVLAMGAVTGSAEAYLSLSIWDLYIRRMPWLLALFIAETLTGNVLRHYSPHESVEKVTLWTSLMYSVPLIIGAGGNAGSQVTTTITRALALGEVSTHQWFRVFSREVITAIAVGGTLGLIAGIRAGLPGPIGWAMRMDLCLLIGLSLPAIILWAASIGSLLPIASKRVGLDPAVLSAPFITTFVDATGLIIYFEFARLLIHGL